MPITKEELKDKIVELIESRGESMAIVQFIQEVRSLVQSPRRLIEALGELEQAGTVIVDGRHIELVHAGVAD